MKKRRGKILLIIVLILGILGAIAYHNIYGFTAKKKYENCARTCEQIMLMESNIPLCRMRCVELYGYDPRSKTAESSKKATPTSTATSKPTIKPQADTTASDDKPYKCEWSWPQKVLNEQTGEVAISCPSMRPWCHSNDLTKDGAGCCADVVEEPLEYFDCKTIAELNEI